MARRQATVLLVWAMLTLAGCVTPGGDAVDPTSGTGANEAASAHHAVLQADRRVRVEVPVPVVLVGFPRDVADALQEALRPLELDQEIMNAGYLVPGPEALSTKEIDSTNGILPVAVFEVHRAPDAEAAAILREVGAARLEGGLLDANAAEALLADRLPDFGVPVRAERPALVILHGGDVLPAGHTYRYTYPNGALDSVRVFGERLPVLVLDISAAADSRNRSPKAYDEPRPPSGAATVDALAEAARDAATFRLVAGPIYPPSPRPCQAITVVFAREAASLVGGDVGVDAERLQATFENLVGVGEVFVDVKEVDLPADDPELAAIVQAHLTHEQTQLLRRWVTANWDRYWVPHEGCGGVVTVVVDGDTADGPAPASVHPLQCWAFTCYYGTSFYDQVSDRRVSFGILSDRIEQAYRDRAEEAGHAFDYYQRIAAHETGHLLGLAHPDFAYIEGFQRAEGFETVWSVMSYAPADRMSEFGAVDHANYHRNLAGALAREVARAGGAADEGFQLALEHMEHQRWREANEVLHELLAVAR